MEKVLEMIEKVCNLRCTKKELDDFYLEGAKGKGGDETFWDKYYSGNTVNNAIKMYEAGKIDDEYLALWTNVYNWIVMGFFNESKEKEKVQFKEVIKFRISDALDGLSFFNDKYLDIEEYKKPLTIYNELYENSEKYKVYFIGVNESETGENDEILLYAINKVEKKYYRIYSGFLYNKYETDMVKITKEEGIKLEKELYNKKYTFITDEEILDEYDYD